jgi:hypothetical protein
MAWAQESDQAHLAVLQGTVLSSVDGSWVPASESLKSGMTVRTEPGSGAVMTLPGEVRLRLDQDTRVRCSQIDGGRLQLKLESGKLFASLPESGDHSVLIDGNDASVRCSQGTFVMDVTQPETRLKVLSGNAQLKADSVQVAQFAPIPALAWIGLPAGFDALAGSTENMPVAQMDSPEPAEGLLAVGNSEPDGLDNDNNGVVDDEAGDEEGGGMNTSETNNTILWVLLGGGGLLAAVFGLGGGSEATGVPVTP